MRHTRRLPEPFDISWLLCTFKIVTHTRQSWPSSIKINQKYFFGLLGCYVIALNLSLNINNSFGWQSNEIKIEIFVWSHFRSKMFSNLAYITPQQRRQVKRKTWYQPVIIRKGNKWIFNIAPRKSDWDTKNLNPRLSRQSKRVSFFFVCEVFEWTFVIYWANPMLLRELPDAIKSFSQSALRLIYIYGL